MRTELTMSIDKKKGVFFRVRLYPLVLTKCDCSES
jgi:hypothetical protein